MAELLSEKSCVGMAKPTGEHQTVSMVTTPLNSGSGIKDACELTEYADTSYAAH